MEFSLEQKQKKRLKKEKRKICNQILLSQIKQVENSLQAMKETDLALSQVSNGLKSVKTQMFSERVSLSISNRHMKASKAAN